MLLRDSKVFESLPFIFFKHHLNLSFPLFLTFLSEEFPFCFLSSNPDEILYMMYSEYQGRLTFNQTKFVRPVTDQEEDEMFTEQVRRLFKADKWIIQLFNFDMKNWSKVVPLISQCPAIEFQLRHLCRNSILKQIIHIDFPRLKVINLQKNRIMSIDILQHLKAPKLIKINLSSNLITSIAPIKKTFFPQLISLTLYSNHITDFSPLTEMISGYEFVNLKLEEYIDEIVKNENLSWVAKLYYPQLLTLCINSMFRIKQYPILQMIANRYLDLQVSLTDPSEMIEDGY